MSCSMRFLTAALILGGAVSLGCSSSNRLDEILIEDHDGRVDVRFKDGRFTSYHYQGSSRPYFHPVFGPGQVPMTRDWPMEKKTPDEAHDHPHHKSLWFSHGDVNGHDFWAEGAKAGRIVQDGPVEISVKDGEFVTRNRWVSHDGKTICRDRRRHRFGRQGRVRFIDFEITIEASEGPLVLGDTKEGTMALRLRPALRLAGKVAKGKAVNSEGVKGAAIWGKRAAWVDYHGPVGERTVGVAIFDHPDNFAHPTWWHARSYGLFAANPFGVHHFEKKPAHTGDHRLEAREPLSLRYRIVFHEGDEKQALIAKRFAKYGALKK